MEDSRHKQPDVHMHDTSKQEHSQGQEEEHGPEAPVGRGPLSTEYRARKEPLLPIPFPTRSTSPAPV